MYEDVFDQVYVDALSALYKCASVVRTKYFLVWATEVGFFIIYPSLQHTSSWVNKRNFFEQSQGRSVSIAVNIILTVLCSCIGEFTANSAAGDSPLL